MSSRYELDVTVSSGKDLKNVNWMHGHLRPYAVAWVDPSARCYTRVDGDNNDDPVWDEKLTVPLPGFLQRPDFADADLNIEVLHADEEGEDGKKVVGMAQLSLKEVLNEVHLGETVSRTLKVKRPSGRRHGKLEISVCVREVARLYEAAVTVSSGKNLKNVNWRHGDLRAYAVLWFDPSAKCSTKVDHENDDDPVWDEKLIVPLPGYQPNSADDDAFLYMDVLHYDAEEGVKPLVGSARLPLHEVVEESGVGGQVSRTIKLRRPSGRPHGKIEIEISVRERCWTPAPYGTPHSYADPTRDVNSYDYNQPQMGYPYGAPPPTSYPYDAQQPPVQAYEGGAPPQAVAEKKSKHGMGTGLAVGAAAGLVGGLAIGGGLAYLATRGSDSESEDGGNEDEVGFDDGHDEEGEAGFDEE